MAIKYLYIDDEESGSLEAYTNAVKGASDEISIDIEQASHFDHQVQHLLKVWNDYDGLILDWRLDRIATIDSSQPVSFRAGTLAQDLRTRATEGNIKDLPIVLWSTDEKLKKSFRQDDTSHDLFDRIHLKEKVADNPDIIRMELVSLSKGYQTINKSVSDHAPEKMLSLDDEIFDQLDVRFTHYFSSNDQLLPTHEYARFLLNEVIQRPGVLISEALLAARLGIDKDKSEDWPEFLNKLPLETKYRGAFHEAWPRWWTHIIEKKWWRSMTKERQSPPLSILPARERVELIKQHTDLTNLAEAIPIKDDYGHRFQTICEYFQKPLDPLDGVIIAEKEPEAWQDRRYLSVDAALERRGWPDLKPDPTELERLEDLKKNGSRHA